MRKDAFVARRGADDSAVRAYCLFCESGAEQSLARILCERFEGVYALPLLQERHRSERGQRSLTVSVMLPGYIFLYALSDMDRAAVLKLKQAYFFLSYAQGGTELSGDDRAFALWVLRYDGLMVCSKALRDGDRVTIVEGPLRDYHGTIRRVDKHRRNAMIEVALGQGCWTCWLSFDWLLEERAPVTIQGMVNKHQEHSDCR